MNICDPDDVARAPGALLDAYRPPQCSTSVLCFPETPETPPGDGVEVGRCYSDHLRHSHYRSVTAICLLRRPRTVRLSVTAVTCYPPFAYQR